MSRRRSALLLGALLVVLALATGCGGTGKSADPERVGEAGSAWQEVAPGPLSPRFSAVGVWTGREVLIIGGDKGQPCPPPASCSIPDTEALRDGAAYEPASGTWREIAQAPVPIEHAQTVVVDDVVYMWSPDLWSPHPTGRPGSEPAFLTYDVGSDRWQRLMLPADAIWYSLAEADARIVAYSTSDEEGARTDLIYDPATDAWDELPDDPLPRSFSRRMVWDGARLVLFAHELVPNPGSEQPSITIAAALDVGSGTWERLPASDILYNPSVRDGTQLIAGTSGSADGGQVNNWGRRVPFGGILDTTTDTWLPLSEHPAGDSDEPGSAGVLTAEGATYWAVKGWALDARTDAWIELPSRAGSNRRTGETIVAAGHDLFVFGGAQWPERDYSKATLFDGAFIWHAPGTESEPPDVETPSPAALDTAGTAPDADGVRPRPQRPRPAAEATKEIALPPGPPSAPRCATTLESVSLERLLVEAPLVFQGLVVEVGGSEDTNGVAYFRTAFEIEDLYRGEPVEPVLIALLNCVGTTYPLEEGESYLVFAEPRTFGRRVDVTAAMGYGQGIFRVDGGTAHNETTDATIDLMQLPESLGASAD